MERQLDTETAEKREVAAKIAKKRGMDLQTVVGGGGGEREVGYK